MRLLLACVVLCGAGVVVLLVWWGAWLAALVCAAAVVWALADICCARPIRMVGCYHKHYRRHG